MVRSGPPPAEGWAKVGTPLLGVGSQSDEVSVSNEGERCGTRSRREASTGSMPRGGWRRRRKQLN